MTSRDDWEGRTGRKWADEWRRTDRSFTGLTDRLLGRASTPVDVLVTTWGCAAAAAGANPAAAKAAEIRREELRTMLPP